jgi:hypothetical protein
MLTIDHIVELYQHGVDIHFKEKPHESGRKGAWIEGLWKVLVYVPSATSTEDLYETVLHEFIHARNDLLTPECDDSERKVELEGKDTYKHNPELIIFIKDLYCYKFEMIDYSLIGREHTGTFG